MQEMPLLAESRDSPLYQDTLPWGCGVSVAESLFAKVQDKDSTLCPLVQDWTQTGVLSDSEGQ